MSKLKLALAAMLFLASGASAAEKYDQRNVLPKSAPPAVDEPAQPEVPAIPPAAQFFAALLPSTEATLREAYRAEYDGLVALIDSGMLGGADETALTTILAQGVADIGTRLQDRMLVAPLVAIDDVLATTRRFLGELDSMEGGAICAPAAFKGSIVLIETGFWDKYSILLDDAHAAFFAAIAAADAAPVTDRVPVSEPDIEALRAYLTEQGMASSLDHLAETTPDNPDNCKAMVALIDGILAMPEEQRARLGAKQARAAAGI